MNRAERDRRDRALRMMTRADAKHVWTITYQILELKVDSQRKCYYVAKQNASAFWRHLHISRSVKADKLQGTMG
jgi:hypothetical protein